MTEMYEEFIMSEGYSLFYSLAGEETDAQDWSLYFESTAELQIWVPLA